MPTGTRRSEHIASANLARLFLASAANVSDWLVDTGFAGGRQPIRPPMEELSRWGGAHEIVRLESVAEEAARVPGVTMHRSFERDFCNARAATAVATKSILAYRGGFAGDLSEPARFGVGRGGRAGGAMAEGVRLTEPVLVALRTCIRRLRAGQAAAVPRRFR